jgi:hypothetical protein
MNLHRCECSICTERGAESELLVNALRAIKRATLNGDVCDDVAWFDQIETLHDFCDRILDAVSSPEEKENV